MKPNRIETLEVDSVTDIFGGGEIPDPSSISDDGFAKIIDRITANENALYMGVRPLNSYVSAYLRVAPRRSNTLVLSVYGHHLSSPIHEQPIHRWIAHIPCDDSIPRDLISDSRVLIRGKLWSFDADAELRYDLPVRIMTASLMENFTIIYFPNPFGIIQRSLLRSEQPPDVNPFTFSKLIFSNGYLRLIQPATQENVNETNIG